MIVDLHLHSFEFVLDEGHPGYSRRTTRVNIWHQMFESEDSSSVPTFFCDHAETVAEQYNIKLYDLVLGT